MAKMQIWPVQLSTVHGHRLIGTKILMVPAQLWDSLDIYDLTEMFSCYGFLSQCIELFAQLQWMEKSCTTKRPWMVETLSIPSGKLT